MGFQIQAAQPLNYIFQAPIPQTPYILNPLFQQKPQPAQMYQNYGNNSYNEAMLNLQFRMKCNPGNMMQAQENKSSKIAEMDKQIWSTLINQNTLLTEMKEKTNALGSFMERMAQDFSELQ